MKIRLKNQPEKLILFVILFVGLTFLVFLIQTSWNIRPCSDDLFFISQFKDKGWFDSIWEQDTNIRFTGFLIFNTICLFAKDFSTLYTSFFIYYVLLFLLLVYAIYKFLKSTLVHFFPTLKASKPLLFSMTLLFIISFYFSTLNAQEVWFWTIATTIYLLPIPLLLLAITEFYNENSKTSSLKTCTLFFLIGGTVENLVLSVLTILILCVFLYWKKNRKLTKKLIYSAFFLTILPLISLLHNGIEKRVGKEAYYSIENGFFKTLFSDFELGINFNRITILVLIYCMFYFLGSMLKTKGFVIPIQPKKWVLRSIFIVVIIFLCTFIPMVSVFGNLGPARASLPFMFIMNVLIVCWLVYLGNRYPIQVVYFIFPATIALFIITLFTYNQFNMTNQFSKAYDQRVEFIKSQKMTKANFILVRPLPDSGVIPTQEVNKLGENPAMTSYYLGRLNGIDKDIYLEPIK